MELGADGTSNRQSSRISCGSNGAVTLRDEQRASSVYNTALVTFAGYPAAIEVIRTHARQAGLIP